VSNKFSNLLYVITIAKKALLNHMMLAVYAGILASVIPGLQDLLYSNTGYLRPLGDSMATIAEPLVCLNCFIMSGSLALTFSAKRAAPQSKDASMDIEIRDLDTSMPVLPRAPTPSFDEVRRLEQSGSKITPTHLTNTTSSRSSPSSQAEPIAKKPPFRSIFIHSALRLFVMPAIIIFIENALAATGALDKDEVRRGEGRLERSDSKSTIPPSYITINLPLVASLLAEVDTVDNSSRGNGAFSADDDC